MKKLPTAAAAAALLRALAHVLDTHGCYWRGLLATGYVPLCVLLPTFLTPISAILSGTGPKPLPDGETPWP